jgi:hypothetical protein
VGYHRVNVNSGTLVQCACMCPLRGCTRCVSFVFFGESSLLRINQRHHSLRTRLWYTPPAAVKNRRRKTPASEVWGWAWAGTVAMDRSMCAHLPPPEAPRRGAPPLLLPPPSVPRIPHPQLVPLGDGVGRRVRWVQRAQVSGSGCLLCHVLEAGRWRASVNSQGDGYTGSGI